MKPNRMLLMCICCSRKFSATLSRASMTWLNNLRHWQFSAQGRRPCPCRGRRWYYPPLGPLIFLLAATILSGFPAFLLLLDCTVDCHIPTLGLFSPQVVLGRPAHIFSCLQQNGLHCFLQISSVPLPLALLDVVCVMKACWHSDWASGSLRRHVLCGHWPSNCLWWCQQIQQK